ncbi:MAG: hypothetical protein E7089_04265 [Bacteroidales bacterium]|nr:hypothetical protein [Bacteroidales bacterium]
MKKILFLLLAVCLLAPAVEAQNSKAFNKALKKEYKTKMKEYKKGKWSLYGSSRSLEVALLSHYEKLNTMGEDAYEIVGVSPLTKRKGLALQAAENDAANRYATLAGSTVKGRIIADAAISEEDFEHFYSAYERIVDKEIRGEMVPSFSVVREERQGLYEIITHYVISESAATKARIRAFENALKESEAAQRHAQKVSEFIKKGIEKE